MYKLRWRRTRQGAKGKGQKAKGMIRLMAFKTYNELEKNDDSIRARRDGMEPQRGSG